MWESKPGWLIPKDSREVSSLTDLCLYSCLPFVGEGCHTQSLRCQSSRRGQRELSDLLSCCEWHKGVFWGELTRERWPCTPPLVWHGHGSCIPRKTFWRLFPQASLPHLCDSSPGSSEMQPAPSFSVGVCTLRGPRELEPPSQLFTGKEFLWGFNLFLKSWGREDSTAPHHPENFSQTQFFVSDLRPPCGVPVIFLNPPLWVWETKHSPMSEGSYLDKLMSGCKGSESVNCCINT